MTSVPTITLNDGTTIPQLGFGVFQIDPENTAASVHMALDAGYRHIDTAQMYNNEQQVGEGIASHSVAREDIWVTTKLGNEFHRPDDAKRSFDESLRKLGTDYVDLFLIHWPLPTLVDADFVSTWKTLIEFQKDGRAKSIGVSNFQPAHLDRLAAETEVRPSVNQIEVHPYFTNNAAREYGQKHNIVTEAWSPIAQGEILDDATIAEIANRVGKSTAQVALRWHLQRGNIIFPKSVTEKRVHDNIDIFDFELTDADLSALDGLDKGEDGRTGPNPDTFLP